MMNRTAHFAILALIITLGTIVGLVSCSKNPVKDDGKDTVRPTVTAVVPVDGDLAVSVSSAVRVTFSEAMDPVTMGAGTLVLVPSANGSVLYANKVLTMTPSGGLDTNVTYHATVTTAAKDEAGNALAAAYTWEFTTYVDTVRPTVAATVPLEGDSATVHSAIVITFSEAMDTTTLNASTIEFSPAVAGTYTYTTKRQVTITPDQALDLPGNYTATVTTAVRDSAGNHLAAPYVWHFHTVSDQTPPVVALVKPDDNTVFNDSLKIQVDASDNDHIARVEFYADGAHIEGADATTYPYEGYWRPTGLTLGSEHSVYALAYDDTGNSAVSDPVTVHYLWRLLVTDPNEPNIPRNISRIYVRSSALKLQFRVETWNGWGSYKDPATGIDVAFFLDVDRNASTGARTTGGGSLPIGDIGADYRLVVGNHGDSVASWNGTVWVPAGLVEDLVISNNSNFFEVSVSLARIANSQNINFIVANVVKNDAAVLVWDWAPDLVQGHATIQVDRTYLGSPPAGSAPIKAALSAEPSPFD